ncbi:putative adaptin ear-binding coat-associated protein 2 [Monocercomonoides exilis]|uniref:putative adaptin ear-binding coat-associated protein 2 n=1 Tax=Monocercomonoides exilis TaxID=2049356 RepID=UPI00355A88DD|nr:putative adaptin ear-binding coat-associated protein 2 [Monocercomonoides exilis]
MSESLIVTFPECFVYRLGPRPTTQGYRCRDWKPEDNIWTGSLEITDNEGERSIILKDPDTKDVFVQCPVAQGGLLVVEPVLDSSRFFVIRIDDETGKYAFFGLGFEFHEDAAKFVSAVSQGSDDSERFLRSTNDLLASQGFATLQNAKRRLPHSRMSGACAPGPCGMDVSRRIDEKGIVGDRKRIVREHLPSPIPSPMNFSTFHSESKLSVGLRSIGSKQFELSPQTLNDKDEVHREAIDEPESSFTQEGTTSTESLSNSSVCEQPEGKRKVLDELSGKKLEVDCGRGVGTIQ